MMRSITRHPITFAATILLALSSLVSAAPAGKRITISGRVIKVNKQERTLLVADQWTKKLYLVNVPEGETFKVTFGQSMGMSQSEFGDANKNDRVRILCRHADKEHLSRLVDASQAIVLTVAR